MGLFDPVAVNRQIDSFLAAVPNSKRGVLVLNADLVSKQASAALVVKVKDNIGAFVRVSKTFGGALSADAGAKISFLVPQDPEPFTYSELVAVLKARGWGWASAHLGAWKLLRGKELPLEQ